MHSRKDITTLDATIAASRKAYDMAGVTVKDIGLLAIEDLGFAKKGEGGKVLEEGQTNIDGDCPINPSGGLKARGHPLGATGIAQAAEIVWQLRGEAGKRQVDGAEIGMTHNVGGTGGTCAVHIFGRDLN